MSNTEVPIYFTVETENFYSASLTSSLWISPAFANHDTGNVIFTLTDFGVFGFHNPVSGQPQDIGSGFRFPVWGTNALYHGSLVVGTSEDRVSDGVFGSDLSQDRFDFSRTSGGELVISSGVAADQAGVAVYRDTRPPTSEQVGVEVTQHSYAWSSPPYDDFVILSFNLQNVSGSVLDNLYVGLYMDWDLTYYNENESSWDASRGLGYTFNGSAQAPNIRYYGMSLLSHSAAAFRVMDSSVQYPPNDAQKYQYMSSGFVQTSSYGPDDQKNLLSAGPFSLSPDEDVEVVFAVLGGEDLDDLKDNADAAVDIWQTVSSDDSGINDPATTGFTIDEVFPRPSNGSIRISFTVLGPGKVSFDLIDPLGRSVSMQNSYYSQGGAYSLSIPRWEGASGIYFLRGRTDYGQSIAKVLWLK